MKSINAYLRSAAYKKLSSLHVYPDDTVFFQLRKEKQELEQLFQAIAAEYEVALQEDINIICSSLESLPLQDAQVEYVRLFDYRPKCFNVESGNIYRRDNTSDPEQAAHVQDTVEDFYARFGLETGCWFKQPPDHISVELEFMHYLTHREGDCLESESDEFEHYQRGEYQFLTEHLLKWAVDFCDCLRAETIVPLYSSIAVLTKSVLLSDAQYLQNIGEILE